MADDINHVARRLAEEVPEIVSGQVEIKAIARKAGCRIKVALISRDPRVLLSGKKS